LQFAPILPIVLGEALSIWRFRAGDELGGLAFGLGGVLAMMVLARWLFRTANSV
jgi:hypothetical protein